MSSTARAEGGEQGVLPELREVADRMFSRAAGAPLVRGNHVRLLEDGREDYPAWLEAIHSAEHHVHFENYFVQDDEVGRQLAEAIAARAREGVPVRVHYDWMGSPNASIGTRSTHVFSGTLDDVPIYRVKELHTPSDTSSICPY
jgi:cardiolipin synthase